MHITDPSIQDPFKERLDIQTTNSLRSTCNFFYGLFKDIMPIKQLLYWVVLGNLAKVGEMLRVNSELVLARNTVTDLSGQTFYGITAFQYAVLKFDIKMWKLIFPNYLDKQMAKEQFIEIEKGKYGAYYNIEEYTTKLDKYIKKYNSWDKKKCKKYFSQNVGEAQRKFPAWLVYAICEEGNDVAWVRNDLKNLEVTRQYEYIKWWFGLGHESGKLGLNWGAVRDSYDRVRVLESSEEDFTYHAAQVSGHLDLEVGRSIKRICDEALNNLRNQLGVQPASENNLASKI